jgi:serine/threonine-protein kinase
MNPRDAENVPGSDDPEVTSVEEAGSTAIDLPEEFWGPASPPGGTGTPSPGESPEPRAPRRHRFRSFLITAGLAVLAFATGLFVFNDLIMPRLIHSVGEVRVPDLTNLTVEQAEKALAPLGLQLSRSGERFDPSVPRGFVLAQDPPPETPVRGRKRVTVVVSLGEEFSSVPALFGESLRSAQYLLERAGLRVAGTTRAPSDEVGDGLVAGSDPPAEAVLARDTPVSLLVSTGGGEESFVMPDLLGREINGVRRQLESLGFRVLTPPAAPSVGTVVFQDPAPGSRITRDSQILLQATGRIIR